MRREAGGSFWTFLILATFAQALQVSFACFAAAISQAPRESTNDKSKEEKPAPSVQVSGKVVDRDGKGVADSEVTFAPVAGPKHGTKLLTDSTGSFTFEGPPGKYTIRVKAGGKSKSFPAEVAKDRLEPSTFILD
jgi:hypothetical protein